MKPETAIQKIEKLSDQIAQIMEDNDLQTHSDNKTIAGFRMRTVKQKCKTIRLPSGKIITICPR